MRPDRGTAAHFETDIPCRLDRLRWSGFHWLVIAALGITWILDGLEVTLVGSLSGTIAADPALGFSDTEIGLAASAYLGGAIIGALAFGHLTDHYGRKRLFSITVAVYAVAHWRPDYPGASGPSRCSVSPPARASAANTRRSIRRSTN